MQSSSPSGSVALGAALATIVLLGGCASSGSSSEGVYQTELGRAPSRALMTSIAESVFESYGYQVRSRQSNRVETDWRTRQTRSTGLSASSEEEEELPSATTRTTQSRDRLRVTLTKRGQRFYVGRFTARHQVQTEEGWQQTMPPEALQERYRAIVERVQNRLQDYMTQ